MGDWIELTAKDGHKLKAYEAPPSGQGKGAVVLLQEIFGVNGHIRGVADNYASRGYHAVAPGLFDRVARDIELGYDPGSVAKGRDLRQRIALEAVLDDVQAAINRAGENGKVAVIGYCWGGSLAFLAATRLDGLACAVGYYGAMIAQHKDERTRVPTILHFGERDSSIPMSDVEAVQRAHPDMSIFTYPAGHGFNCDARKDYDAQQADLALQRTLRFIEEKLTK
jgi:carboxymethylenebutenolidase